MESKEDEVLGRIGNFGAYQLIVIGIVHFVGMFNALSFLVRNISNNFRTVHRTYFTG